MVILRATDNFGNKEDLDILQEGGLFCDISAIESGDIGQLFGVSSKEFMLPGTDKNNKFFGNLYDLGADPSVALNHTIYCSVLIDGQEGFEGRLYLNDILKDDKGYVMYKAVVINETVDFKTRIKDLSLSDLDFSDYDHALNFANVTGSWYGDLFSGDIVYPLIDFGTSVPITTIAAGTADITGSFTHEGSPLSISNLKPSIRVKSVIDAVFDQVDYNYSSSFLDSDYFSRVMMVMTPDENAGIPGEAPTNNKLKAGFSGSSAQTVADGATATVLFPTEYYDNGNNYDPVSGEYTVATDGNYDVYANLELQWAGPLGTGEFYRAFIEIQVNGTTVESRVQYTPGTLLRCSISRTLKNLSAGDIISIQFTNSAIQTGTGNTVSGNSVDIRALNTSVLNITPSVLANITVQMRNMFAPELKVRDFMQGLIEQFNLVIEPVQDDRKTLKIEPFNTWRDGGAEKDWSDKVDHSVRKSIKGTMIDNPHLLNFANEEDTDYLNAFNQDNYGKVFGEALYTSDSDLTEGERKIGSFFAPTPVAAIDGTDGEIIPHIYEVDNDTKKPFKFKPRLLHNTGRRSANELIAYDTSGNVDGTGYYLEDLDGNVERFTVFSAFHYLDLDADEQDDVPIFAETRDLNFNNSQQFHYVPEALQVDYYVERDCIFEYWSQYLNELYNPESKKLTLNLMFTPDEIKDIRLNDKIFIDGHYYRIDTISNFDLINEASTQVTLIKQLVRKFNYPVRRIYNIDGSRTGTTGSNGNDLGGQYNDVTIERLNPDGSVTYVFVDDFAAVTGSGNQLLVSRASALDGYNYISNDSGSAIWNSVPTQPTVQYRRQLSQGNNTIDYSADNINAQGFNNVVENNTNIISIHGSGNRVKDNTQYISVQGDNNTVESFANKSSIISSTRSTITERTELGTIISGEDTIISGSNKSIAIGQDLTIEGGNSNVVIGNVDTTNKTVKDLVNVTAINLNKDIESIENAGGDHYSGIAQLGTYNQVGGMYRDYAVITGSNGGTTYLTGSDFANAYYIHLTWQGANGTHTIHLPDTSRTALSRDGNGYKRELRFFSDNSLVNNSTIFRLQPSGSDVIDGTTFSEDLKRPLDGVTIFGTPGQWFTLQRKSK